MGQTYFGCSRDGLGRSRVRVGQVDVLEVGYLLWLVTKLPPGTAPVYRTLPDLWE